MENKLLNSGYTFLNFKLSEERKFQTYVVLGLGRSGTSMVAGTLNNLGVFMGDNLGHTYEDPKFSKLCESKDFESVEKMIFEKNQAHMKWGWKRPSSINYINIIDDMFTDVVFLVVWRDIFSIANRNKISMEYDLFESMENSINSYKKLLSFVKKTNKPMVLISYEKAMLKKDVFVEVLSSLIDSCSTSQKKNALSFITENPKEYLQNSRITNPKGVVGRINCNKINGWVFYPKIEDRVVTVNLLVNNKVIAKVQANQYRKRLKEQGIHKTGFCGFEFNNFSEYNINIGDEIIVMAENDIKELNNGKYIVTQGFYNE